MGCLLLPVPTLLLLHQRPQLPAIAIAASTTVHVPGACSNQCCIDCSVWYMNSYACAAYVMRRFSRIRL